ncbi:4-hydroxy-tetrahydrodipicolinate reductase [Natrialbaceae archaeon A-gly3]
MTVRVGVTGAAGRMGREVLAAVAAREDCETAFAVNRSELEGPIEGVEVDPASEFDALVANVDVVIDFTGPGSAVEYATACAEAGVAFVTGTTGFSDDGLESLQAASEEVPVLHAPNFSRGVQVLLGLVGEAVEGLPDYDVELVEAHHNRKRDAPSGTANRLLDEIEEHGDFSGRTHGREGEQPREDDEIGVHVLRAGGIRGEHEVVLADDHEELRLTHRAEDRGVFASGAVDAAEWIAGRKSGWYDFADVIDQ